MGKDPYESGLLKKSPYVSKETVFAKVVAILDFASEERGLKLISQPSRAVREGDVHELIITSDKSASPGGCVNEVSYIAFVKVQNSGVILKNDVVKHNGKRMGTLAGFDETHMPNHQNILLYSPDRISSRQLGIQLGDMISFGMENENK